MKKKKKPKIYENYPLGIIFLANLLMILVILAGAYIMFRLNLVTGFLYLIFIFFLEFNIYREGCRYCCYYDGWCAFGKGKIAKLFFKKGNPKKFGEREITWKDFLPLILASLIPILVGIALLISRGFNLLTLIATIYPAVNWVVINPIAYGKLACPHCKQGTICCPALKFFAKK
jgi:hypothetical protein